MWGPRRVQAKAMHSANWIVAAALAISGISLPASAGPAAGEYATQPGWGGLVISADEQGRQRFELFSVGANGHTCQLSGIVQGTDAVTGDESADVCRMTFDSDGARVSVRAVTEETCRSYCGMRGSFEGDYSLLPPACRPSARERRNATFLSDYKAKRYTAALAKLDGLERECGGFFSWLEQDQFANDRAITLLHLGRPGQCLTALGKTLAAKSHDEDSLDESVALPPIDRDMYLPIARATWFNRDRCKAAMKR